MPSKLRPGTPSIRNGRTMPCQWIEVGTRRRLLTRRFTVVPSRMRSNGPGTPPLTVVAGRAAPVKLTVRSTMSSAKSVPLSTVGCPGLVSAQAFAGRNRPRPAAAPPRARPCTKRRRDRSVAGKGGNGCTQVSFGEGTDGRCRHGPPSTLAARRACRHGRSERGSAGWRPQRWRVHDAGRGREGRGNVERFRRRRHQSSQGGHLQQAAARRRAMGRRHRVALAEAVVGAAAGRDRHGIRTMIGRVHDGRCRRAPQRVAGHPARHAMHRCQRENQPRQPCHRPEGRQACGMAKQVIHRHSIGLVPASLNSGHGSIGPCPAPVMVRRSPDELLGIAHVQRDLVADFQVGHRSRREVHA